MRVTRNRVPYDLFDGLRTTGEHLLIVPKRHVALLREFTEQERTERMNLMVKYEALGYSVYARSHTNVNRSQPHQHTHLIKLSTKAPSLVLALRKPYFLLTK